MFMDYRRDDECTEDSQARPTVYPQPGSGLKVFPRSPQMAKPLGNLNSAETRDFGIDRFTLPIGVRIYTFVTSDGRLLTLWTGSNPHGSCA